MRLPWRFFITLWALAWCGAASSWEIKTFAGTPDLGLRLLWWIPPIACAIEAGGVGLEWLQAHRQGRELEQWRNVMGTALGLQLVGLGLMSWRAIWMFFSWNGMQYFPAWLLLAAATWRRHRRWVPAG